MRFLHCVYGLLSSSIILKISHYPTISNTRFITPLFTYCENDKFFYGSEERKGQSLFIATTPSKESVYQS